MALELAVIGPPLSDEILDSALGAARNALEDRDAADCARCWELWGQHLEGGRPLSSEEHDLSISWECAIGAMENTLASHGIFNEATLVLRPAADDPRQAGLL